MNVSTKVIVIITLLFTTLTFNNFSQAPDTLWTKTFGRSNSDWARSAQQTTDGGYIILGETRLPGNYA